MLKLNDKLCLFQDEGYIAVRWNLPSERATLCRLPGAIEDAAVEGLVLLPWCDDICRVLTNMGYDTSYAAPFLFCEHPKVEGKYAPMLHQLLTSAFICLNPHCFVLSDPRTGKTASTILAMDYLQRARLVTGGWLIATTVTTMQSVWLDSIKKTLPQADVVIAHQSSRKAALERQHDFYITNYDSVRISLDLFKAAVDEGRIGGLVVDELTHCGNATSQRSKAFLSLAYGQHPLPYVIGLTGSPGDNPRAVYGMSRLVNPANLPVKTLTGWLSMTTYQYGFASYMIRNKPEAPEIFHRTMQPAIRFKKSDIMDLPKVVTQERECGMSREQKEIRERLLDDMTALLDSGDVITAANGGVLLQKMLQTALGFCIAQDGKVVELRHDNRTQTIIDLIGETDRKVVVFICFKYAMRQRKKELEDAGLTVELIDGSVSGAERARILHDFQNSTDPRVLIAHPQTVSYGVELSAADTLVFDGPPLLGTFVYVQALERLSSAKQTADHISIIRIAATPDEARCFKKLDEGKAFGDVVASMFEDFRNHTY